MVFSFITPVKHFRRIVFTSLPWLQRIKRLTTRNQCLRVVFYGTQYIYTLDALNSNRLLLPPDKVIDSLSVVCKDIDSNVRRYAVENNLTVYSWPHYIAPDTYDVGIVNNFGQLIPSSSIQACKYGMINLHPSLLPRWRGAAPVYHTVLNGDVEAGVTILQVAPKKFDSGNIFLQEAFKIPDPDRITVKELHMILQKKGADLMMRILKDLPNYIKSSYPQSETGVTYAPKIKPQQGRIEWETDTMGMIQRKLNTFKDIFPVFTYLRERKVVFVNCLEKDKVDSNKISSLIDSDTFPGFLYFEPDQKAIFVKCQDGWFGVKSLKVSSYGKMSAKQFYKKFMTVEKECCFKSFESEEKI